jgi:hypothetical protein
MAEGVGRISTALDPLTRLEAAEVGYFVEKVPKEAVATAVNEAGAGEEAEGTKVRGRDV